jgi:hypothetical protein
MQKIYEGKITTDAHCVCKTSQREREREPLLVAARVNSILGAALWFIKYVEFNYLNSSTPRLHFYSFARQTSRRFSTGSSNTYIYTHAFI